jgi:hypothetical protein
MKRLLCLLSLLTVLPLVGNDDLLLNVGFDGTLKAEKANGSNIPVVKRIKQAQFTDGVSGKAVRLNQNGCINYSVEKNIDAEQGTIAFWMRPADWNPRLRTNTYHWIFSVNKSGAKVDRFQLFKMPGPLMMFFYGKHDKVKKLTFSIGKWKLKQWHFIAFTWGQAQIKLYVDGKLLRTVKISMEQMPSDLNDKITLQGGLETTDYDNFQIYKRPLSGNEIKALYNKYNSKLPVPEENKKLKQISSMLFKAESVKVNVTPSMEFDFDRIKPGVKQHQDVKYTYDKVPPELLNGLLFRGNHRVHKGTGISITLLEPARIYFFFHPSADGGYTNIFLKLKNWEVCDTAPQYDIHNGTHGLKMTMYCLNATPGTYTIPPTTKANACFSMVFCTSK